MLINLNPSNDDKNTIKVHKRNPKFYVNTTISILKVINHFEVIKEAFDGFSEAKLIRIEEDMSMPSFVSNLISVVNNKETSHYYHEINKNIFKTKYIINPFSSVLINYESQSECELYLTDEGHLQKIRFSAVLTSVTSKIFWVEYNDFFAINAIVRSHYNIENGYIKDIVVNAKSYIDSIESESYFLRWFLSDAAKKIGDYLPEYIIPSAYNFNTDEFAIRLKIAEMLLI